MDITRLYSIPRISVLILLLALCGCGGSGGSGTPPVLFTITSVSVVCPENIVNVGQTVDCYVNVHGTGYYSSDVTWSVNGILGGNVVNGTINQGGYVAPNAIPPANPVTITATSVADPTKSGSATISVFTISISPEAVTLIFGQGTQQFTANVAGVSNPVIQWKTFSGWGSLDANGFYTAPDLLPFDYGNPITQTVQANLSGAVGGGATATVTLKFPLPAISSITPNGASANEGITINGQNFYECCSAILFPGPNGGTLPAIYQPFGSAPTPTQIQVLVPPGAESGQLIVQIEQEGSTVSASAPFTRLPNLRIRAPGKDLSSGETLQFQFALLGASSPNTVNWTADIGSISTTGLYQAPTVSQETFATVTACLAETRSCDATLLRIVPLRIEPTFPVTSLGQALQLSAVEGSPTTANWSLLAGGLGVDSTGLFTAPTNPLQAGGEPVLATNGSANELASVAVRGAWPGLLSRTYDYVDAGFDPQTQQPKEKLEGTQVQNLTVSGNRAYALDLSVRSALIEVGTLISTSLNPPFLAWDVYDITDPINPVWLGASESLSLGPRLVSSWGHYLYDVNTNNGTGSLYGEQNRITLYDIENTLPSLIGLANTPSLLSVFDNNGVIYGTPVVPYGVTAPFPIYAFDITNGTIQQSQFNITPPPSIPLTYGPLAAIGSGNTLYCFFQEPGTNSAVIATYDVSANSPNLIGSTSFTPDPNSGLGASGMSALIRGNFLFFNNGVFDISNGVPALLNTLRTQLVLDVQGNILLGIGILPNYVGASNYVVADFTDPTNPTIKASVLRSGNPVLLGNSGLMLANDFLYGISTYDIGKAGGMIEKARIEAFPGGLILDHAVSQQTLYVAGESGLGTGGLLTYDLSTGTPVFLGVLLYGSSAGTAVQVSGNHLFLGLYFGANSGALKTVDISNPANPVETGSLALPTSALALSNNILFDATTDGRLVTLDVTNPNSPSIVGTMSLPTAATNLRLIGSTLYVADGSAGLLIFDVSNPTQPVQLSQFALSSPVWDVAVSGNLAFLAADAMGLVIADISNPMQPKQLSQTALAYGTALSIRVQNSLVYVGTANGGGFVAAFDYAQPSYPRLIAMNYFGETEDALITGMTFYGSDILMVGSPGVEEGIVQADNSSPQNVINLYQLPAALQGPPPSSAQLASATKKAFVHPKFDRHLFQKQHRGTSAENCVTTSSQRGLPADTYTFIPVRCK